jgi:hypothetical protein
VPALGWRSPYVRHSRWLAQGEAPRSVESQHPEIANLHSAPASSRVRMLLVQMRHEKPHRKAKGAYLCAARYRMVNCDDSSRVCCYIS